MTNTLSQASLLDGSSINPQQSFDLQYWSEKFGVSQDEVARAIAKVGPVVGDVRRELGISNGDF